MKRRQPPLVFLSLALLFTGYALLAPAVVNGDGVGYLRQIPGESISPGHPLYLPLVRSIAAGWRHDTSLGLVFPLRLLSLFCAAGALGFVYAAGRRLGGRRPAIFSAAFLGVSFGVARSAVQIETYAPALLFVAACLWSLVRFRDRASSGRAALAGLLAGMAAQFHLTLLLLGPSTLAVLHRWGGRRRRTAPLLAASAGFAAAALIPLTIALADQQIYSPGDAWTWLRSADHGIAYPLSWRSPAVAAWGLMRTLSFAPYPHDASFLAVSALTLMGGGAWVSLLFLRRRSADTRRVFDGVSLLMWAAPLSIFAALFFPSDTERWVFVLPAIALWLSPAAGRGAWRVLAAVLVLNLAAVHVPRALDSAPAARAAAAERSLPPAALLISPGHGWDELVGLGMRAPLDRYQLVYHAGAARDLDRALATMHRRIVLALSAGRSVYVARLKDRRDRRGFKELEWMGIDPRAFAGQFDRYGPRPAGVDELWRLHGRAAAPPRGPGSL